ncbi:MAG: sulfatase-like hydrolase/transferase [Verrucomicrobia bacterium]|nr:sulfatase-like hydrolase/transferase [Verrucomicrobiota bacterium]
MITRWCDQALRAGRLACAALALGLGTSVAQTSRPNLLWITAEDLGVHLGCYGDPDARTPRLDTFAREGVRYTHAFATAPVCSPARSCLITGLYATSLGTQRLRSQFPIPADLRGFAALLREAGYYTANNVKTDYNLRNEPRFIADCWHESSSSAHWRGRQAGQPFFAVFNLMTTHQSRVSVWSRDQFEAEVGARLRPGERHDPAHVHLPPYYPDTPAARQAWARYHDCVTAMDQEVGALLDQLAADGLADDTIVFFYGDNGMGLPRGKRCLWDTGLRVPLLIRFPPKFRGLAPAPPGATTDRLVSFVDFAPTMLGLAGVPAPPQLQGVAFLGSTAGPPREFVFGARDRVDEAFDLSRSVRDQRFLYVRNFMPHVSRMAPEGYSDAAPFRRELTRLAAEGKLDAGQLTYAGPRKPIEELYDTHADPHQIQNLATAPAHRDTLERLRQTLRRWLLTTRDAGFLTEPQVWERLGPTGTPLELARDDTRYPLARLLETADLVGRPDAVAPLLALLRDADDGVRCWAAVGLHAAGPAAESARPALRRALTDDCAVVRVEAAAALVGLGEAPEPLRVLEQELRSTQPDVALHAARALQLLGPRAAPAWPVMREILEQARREEPSVGDPAMYLRFSLEAALGLTAQPGTPASAQTSP